MKHAIAPLFFIVMVWPLWLRGSTQVNVPGAGVGINVGSVASSRGAIPPDLAGVVPFEFVKERYKFDQGPWDSAASVDESLAVFDLARVLQFTQKNQEDDRAQKPWNHSTPVGEVVDPARSTDDSTCSYAPNPAPSKEGRNPKTGVRKSLKAKKSPGGSGKRARLKGQTKHVCPHCDKNLETRYKLERHIRCHTGERPFWCTFENCTDKFGQKSSLKTHSKIHARKFLKELQEKYDAGSLSKDEVLTQLDAKEINDHSVRDLIAIFFF